MEAPGGLDYHQQALYVINGLITIIFFVGWFFVRGVISNQKAADEKISELTTKLAVNSAEDKNHKEQFEKIERWMVRIEGKLDALKT